MDILKENIVKFIDSLIVEDYSNAHKFLEVVINEKVKQKIKKAAKQKVFGKKEEKQSPVVGNLEKMKKGREFEQAKKPNKKKLVKENHSVVIKLMDELPDGSNAQSALFHFKDYYDGQWSAMYKVMSSGRIRSDEISNLMREVSDSKNIAHKNGDVEVADDFEQLLKELSKLEQKFSPQE